jgi:hypothetical protein
LTPGFSFFWGEFAGYEGTEHPKTGKSWKMVNFPLKEGVRTSDDGIFGKSQRISLKVQRQKNWGVELFFPDKGGRRGGQGAKEGNSQGTKSIILSFLFNSIDVESLFVYLFT